MLSHVALKSQIGIDVVVVRGGVEAMVLGRCGRRSRPWIGELGRIGVRHVVEVHAAEALLIVDGHSHLKDDRVSNVTGVLFSPKNSRSFKETWIRCKIP